MELSTLLEHLTGILSSVLDLLRSNLKSKINAIFNPKTRTKNMNIDLNVSTAKVQGLRWISFNGKRHYYCLSLESLA